MTVGPIAGSLDGGLVVSEMWVIGAAVLEIGPWVTLVLGPNNRAVICRMFFFIRQALLMAK
jgi:hypothetical protein